jgi:hypothetical protein
MTTPAPPPPPPVPPAPPSPPAPPEGSRSKLVYGLIAALALIVPAGVGIGVGASILESAPAAEVQATGDTTETPTPEPSTPAPVVQPVDFSSPSGNIRCHIDAEAAYCHQGGFVYTEPADDCSAEGVAVGVTPDGAFWPCLSARPALQPSVEYDVPVVNGEFTCVINFTTGARCINAAGEGFTMEYTAGITTF